MTVKFTRTNLLLFSLLTALSPETLLAGVGRWTNSGPDGGSVLTIASHPSNPSIVYAATSQGLYKSVDAGGFWTLLLSGGFGHVIPTSDPSVVYATSGSGGTIFRTTDGAQTWAEFGSHDHIYGVTVEPDDPRTLYAITVQGLFRSADGAFTWERLPNPAGGAFGGTGIAVDPEDSRYLYALVVAPHGFGVHRSSDRGATWSPTSLREATRVLLFDPRNPSRLFAATSSGLYVTTDRGGSWRRLGAQRDFTHLAIDPADSGRMYAISGGAVYRSSNGGETMTPVSADLGQAVATIAASANVVLAGSEIGAYRSDDGGGDWRNASRGIREISVRSVAIDPSDPSVVFAATGRGIYESRDGAASWSGLLTRIPSEAVAIDPTDRSTLYAVGEGGVSKSTDGGRSWHDNGMLGYLSDLLIDPNNARRILAAHQIVYRTADGGDSWSPVMRPEEDYAAYYYAPTVTSMEFAPSDRTVVYASASDSPRSVYRSRDSGESWTALAAHLPGLNALAIDSCDPAIVHTGAWNGVYRTLDGGETWAQSSHLPQVFALARDPRHPCSVFAGTSAGLFWTNDRGTTWTRFEPALTEPVRALAVDPSGRFLHAVTDPGGLPLGGVTGQGVFSLERTFDACTKGADRLCLVGEKYQVSLTARHPRTGASIAGRAIEEGDRFGYFSFPDVTEDAGFPEVFVKMVDARAAPPPYGGHAWVFHSSLTDLDYTLTVRETETGRVRTYAAADSASLTCGWSDTSAFVRGCAEEDCAAASSAPGARLAAPTGAELALLNGRFRASLRATDPRTGRIAEGAALSRADGFGYFSLPAFTGDPSFPEVFVKMTDATGLPGGGFWVFHTGLTDVAYTLTVTDQVTGAVRSYRRGAPGGTELCGEADTSAFP